MILPSGTDPCSAKAMPAATSGGVYSRRLPPAGINPAARRWVARWVVLVLGVVVASVASGLQAPVPFKPGKLLKEEQAALMPGLRLSFYKNAVDIEPVDTRRVR